MSNDERSSSRRDFVRLMLGGFVAPSMVWPFRKYFIPPAAPQFWSGILWASTYHDRPGNLKIVNAAVPEAYSYNYFFVGKDGSITQPSPEVTLAQFDGKRLRALRSHTQP